MREPAGTLSHLAFSELAVGQEVEEEVLFDEAQLSRFRELSGDDAPIHRDDEFARSLNMTGRILFGMLTALPLSRLLGCRLPGAFSIIESLRLDFVQPVKAGARLRYRLAVTQLSAATKTVALSIEVRQPEGLVVMRGRVLCGMLR